MSIILHGVITRISPVEQRHHLEGAGADAKFETHSVGLSYCVSDFFSIFLEGSNQPHFDVGDAVTLTLAKKEPTDALDPGRIPPQAQPKTLP